MNLGDSRNILQTHVSKSRHGAPMLWVKQDVGHPPLLLALVAKSEQRTCCLRYGVLVPAQQQRSRSLPS